MRFIVTMLVTLIVTSPSQAQTACGPLQLMLDNFKKKYGEIVIWEGLGPKFRTVLIANGEGRWSVFMVSVTGGPACIVAAGDSNRSDKGI